MNFFILCAGLGKRIRKYSGQKPKCLIKFNNKELLSHWIDGINSKKNKILINKHYGTKYINKYINNLNTNVKIYSVYEKQLLGSLGLFKVSQLPAAQSGAVLEPGSPFHEPTNLSLLSSAYRRQA